MQVDEPQLNDDPLRSQINNGGSFDFSEETINSLAELGDVLKSIHSRLISEGYIIENGKFLKKIS